MRFFEERTLKDTIEIDAPVSEVWKFFENLDTNYKSWHPESHIKCVWIKGRPHEEGSIAYFEEMLDGKLCKIKVLCTKIVNFERVECKSFFPLSVFHPEGRYLFESKGNKCIFTAINTMRIPRIFNKRIKALIEATETHMKEEGVNLKMLMEKAETNRQ